MDGLTPKQQRFVEEYLVDFNATQAAIRAGYSERSARMQASRMLTKANVQDVIASRKAELTDDAGTRARTVLQGLQRIIQTNPLDYLDFTDPNRPTFNLARLTPEQAALIQDITFHPRTGRPVVKFCDKVSAYAHLGKFEGLSKERHEHTGPGGGPIRVEVEFVTPARKK